LDKSIQLDHVFLLSRMKDMTGWHQYSVRPCFSPIQDEGHDRLAPAVELRVPRDADRADRHQRQGALLQPGSLQPHDRSLRRQYRPPVVDS